MVLAKVDIHLQKNEIRSTPLSLYKYKVKLDPGPQPKTRNIESVGKSRESLQNIGIAKNYLSRTLKAQERAHTHAHI